MGSTSPWKLGTAVGQSSVGGSSWEQSEGGVEGPTGFSKHPPSSTFVVGGVERALAHPAHKAATSREAGCTVT